MLCTGAGGILQYRDRYPHDGHLRLWSGLVLYRQGRHALAAGEFAAAIRQGRDHPRVHCYLATAVGARAQRGLGVPHCASREVADRVEEVLAG